MGAARPALVFTALCALIFATTAQQCWSGDQQFNRDHRSSGSAFNSAVVDWSQTPAKVYFTETANSDFMNPQVRLISRNLDGSDRKVLVCTRGCPKALERFFSPRYITVEQGYVYWIDAASNTIGRVRKDGGDSPAVILCQDPWVCTSTAPWLTTIQSILVHPSTNTVYFSTLDAIAKTPLNGSATPVAQRIVCADGLGCPASASLSSPLNLRIEPGTGYLFWSDYSASVYRIHVPDATGFQIVGCPSGCNLQLQAQISSPPKIAIDPIRDELFVVDGRSIVKTQLDGTGKVVVVCNSGCPNVPPGGISTRIGWLDVHPTNGGPAAPPAQVVWLDRGPDSSELADQQQQRLQRVLADGTGAQTLLGGANTGGASIPRYARFIANALDNTVRSDVAARGVSFANSGPSWNQPVFFHYDFDSKKVIELVFNGNMQQYVSFFGERPFALGGGLVWSIGGRIVSARDTSCAFGGEGPPPSQLICPQGCANANRNVGDPLAIQYDKTNGNVFWADKVRGALMRSKSDGSGVQVLLCFRGCSNALAASNGRFSPDDLRLDRVSVAAGPRLYWIDSTNALVGRSNLDGTGSTVLACGPSGTCSNVRGALKRPLFLQLDVSDSAAHPWLVWADGLTGRLSRVRGSGDDYQVIICQSNCPADRQVGPGYLISPISLDLDIYTASPSPPYYFAYWGDNVAKHIVRVTLGAPFFLQEMVCQSNTTFRCVYLFPEMQNLFDTQLVRQSETNVWVYFSYGTGSQWRIARVWVGQNGPLPPQVVLCSATPCPVSNVNSSLREATQLMYRGGKIYWVNRPLNHASGTSVSDHFIMRMSLTGSGSEVFVPQSHLVPEATGFGAVGV